MERGRPNRAGAGAGTAPVHGVLLAAGRSTRMGRSKPLLTLDGEMLIERAVRVLREGGCGGVIAVVRAQDDDAARLAHAAGARVVVNDDAQAEQVDSLRLALRELPDDAAAAAVLPVDVPFVRPATVARLLAAFRSGAALVVRPTYRGEPGHPTLFARALFGELAAPGLPHGARTVIEAHAADTLDIEVDDPGVTQDVDTPEDLARYGDARWTTS
ncbi:MAG TPA: nucleotidyltransferase family protein [Longimicrobiales bacterium]